MRRLALPPWAPAQATAVEGWQSEPRALAVFGWAIGLAPAAVVLHELGHLAAKYAWGVPGIELHYASVSDAAAEGALPLAAVVTSALAGPVVTMLLVVAGAVAVWRIGPRPAFVALPYAAGVRTVLLSGAYALVRTFNSDRAGSGNFDELEVARALGASPDVLVFGSVAVVLCSWVVVARALPAGRRARTAGVAAGGVLLGAALWMNVVGPAVLP